MTHLDPREHIPYHPSARRPIADVFRRTATTAVEFCVRRGVHPDSISYLSMVASALAGICFWMAGTAPWLLVAAPLFCYIRLWFNMLDGMVALASGKASRRGEILNELPDRVSDVIIFAGVAHSGLCAVLSGYWTALASLFTAYVGTLGQAVSGHREFGGLMSKQWRMVALHVGVWVMLGDIWRTNGKTRLAGLTMLDWTCTLIIAGCVQTIVIRLRSMFRRLRSR